ncbi:hypothetical protein [Salipiger mucosus]|uniref:hypothetical protein n=1 Tax=Salipiger mucosus TaxID=263378 RepID=UPI0003728FEC|nr:hypothetical protein [Salipiger mucosus]
MANDVEDREYEKRCMAALLDYVERYGLTELAREALVDRSTEGCGPVSGMPRASDPVLGRRE